MRLGNCQLVRRVTASWRARRVKRDGDIIYFCASERESMGQP